jgi:hypothetical protein
MTDDELHDAILADPEAKVLADAGRDAECAALIGPRLPPRIVPTVLNESGILRVLGPDEGDAALTAFEQAAQGSSKFARIVRHLHAEGIDFGTAVTRTQLDQLQAAGVLTPAQVAVLKAAAERPRAPTAADVSRALVPYRQGQGPGA